MLSTEFKNLTKRDEAVQGLSTLMKPKAFIRVLGSYFPEKNLEKMRMKYIRYKPGVNCLVRYQLKVDGQKIEIHAKAFGADKRTKIQKSKERKTVNATIGAGRIFLEDQGIMVGLFPNDNKINSLKHLDGGKNQKRIFRKLFPQRQELWKGKLQTLNYSPERRYVGVIKTKNGFQAVVKFYDDVRFPKSKNNANIFKSQKHLRITQCIGCNDQKRILGFEWVNGKELGTMLLEEPKAAITIVKKTGMALAELHSQKVKGLGNLIPKDEAVKFTAVADLLKFICPHLTDQVEQLGNWLQFHMYSAMSVTTPIHGDFKANQVIVDPIGGTTFIDFDNAALGDPRLDLGSFIAYLHYESLLGKISTNLFLKLKDSFLKTYQAKTGQTFVDLELFIAARLFKLAYRPFRLCQPNWVIQSEQIVKLVERIISNELSKTRKGSTTLSIASTDKSLKLPSVTSLEKHDSNLPFLTFAMNPKTMEPYLIKLFKLKNGKVKANLRGIKQLRYKPGKRCLIEYSVNLMENDTIKEVITLLGKTHRKGLDKTTYLLQKSLWNNGFHSKSSDKISIPKPMGMIPEVKIWLQKKVQGVPSIHILVKKNGEELAKSIAEAIFKVHQTNIPIHKTHTIQDEVRILDERLQDFCQKNPSLSKRIYQVLDSCKRVVRFLPKTDAVGIHRDFYHDQVIVKGKRLYLIDFDLYCKGDPSLDAGNFIGHLQEFALRKFGDPMALLKQENAFLERFLELSGESRRRSVEVYTTLTLVRHISISQQFSERRQYTEAILSHCEKRLRTQLSHFENNSKIIAG